MEDALEARRALDLALRSDAAAEARPVARAQLLARLQALTARGDLLPGLADARLPEAFARAELWRAVRAAAADAAAPAKALVDREEAAKKSRAGNFDAWYMENATRALGNELDRLRQDEVFRGDEQDMEALVESLRVGAQDACFDADLKALCSFNEAK